MGPVRKNAENFSTKALAMKVVLFEIKWSALAYERQKLLRFKHWGHFDDWGDKYTFTNASNEESEEKGP